MAETKTRRSRKTAPSKASGSTPTKPFAAGSGTAPITEERPLSIEFLTLFEVSLEHETVVVPDEAKLEYAFNTFVNIHQSTRPNRTVGSTTFNIASSFSDAVATKFKAIYIWGIEIEGGFSSTEMQKEKAIEFSRLVIWQKCRLLLEQVISQGELDFPRPPTEAIGIEFAGFIDHEGNATDSV